VHKGSHDKPVVVIRFPASTDVRWYRAPKFQPGQQGHFMLHKTNITKKSTKKRATKAAAGATHAAALEAAAPEEAEAEEVYTALHPIDYQPYGEAGGINSLIEANTDGQSG